MPHVCVVVGGGVARARRLRRPLVGPQRFGRLIPCKSPDSAHRRAGDKGPALFPSEPRSPPPAPADRTATGAALRLRRPAGGTAAPWPGAPTPPRAPSATAGRRPRSTLPAETSRASAMASRAFRSCVTLERGAGVLDLPHGRALAPAAALGDAGQTLPFGGGQVPYVLQGQGILVGTGLDGENDSIT